MGENKYKSSSIPMIPTLAYDEDETCPTNIKNMLSKRAKMKLRPIAQNLFVHCLQRDPPFPRLDRTQDYPIPSSKSINKETSPFFKEGFKPKVQVENTVEYGTFSRGVVEGLRKRIYALTSVKSELEKLGLDLQQAKPSVVHYRYSTVSTSHNACETFLELQMFDDEMQFETRSQEEWMSLATCNGVHKAVPGLAFIPTTDDLLGVKVENRKFEWQKVAVLDYDDERNMYFVRRLSDKNRDPALKYDLLVPRIYLKFDAEDPMMFAWRFYSAFTLREAARKSISTNFSIICMPNENDPGWKKCDLDTITGLVRKRRPEPPRLQWIKEHLDACVPELEFEYQTNRNRYLISTEFKDFKLFSFNEVKRPRLIKADESCLLSNKDRIKFRYQELRHIISSTVIWNSKPIVDSILAARKHLGFVEQIFFHLPMIRVTVDEFKEKQKQTLAKTRLLCQGTWMTNIANSVIETVKHYGKGSVDLNQTEEECYYHTKIGKLLTVMNFMAEDMLRSMVINSLERYVNTFEESFRNIPFIDRHFKWDHDFYTTDFAPAIAPIFQVKMHIRGVYLESSVPLQQYKEVVVELFSGGIEAPQDLPVFELYMMKKLFVTRKLLLRVVDECEIQIVRWRAILLSGMDKSIIVVRSYTLLWNTILNHFNHDAINYVKKFARKKLNCEQLKNVIAMHLKEEKRLTNILPPFIDIGPFHLKMDVARQDAIEKHRILAKAVMEYYFKITVLNIETVYDQFLELKADVFQQTGNIEDLLEKQKWFNTVPRKVELLSRDILRARSDYRLMRTDFFKNISDDSFTLYWDLIDFPKDIMIGLKIKRAGIPNDWRLHRSNLTKDGEVLRENLNKMLIKINKIAGTSDIKAAAKTASHLKKFRSSLKTYEELSETYNMREKLFQIEITNYDVIHDMSIQAKPYEEFWIGFDDIKKFRTLQLEEESLEGLKEMTEKYEGTLEKLSEFFTEESNPEMHKTMVAVTAIVKDFKKSM